MQDACDASDVSAVTESGGRLTHPTEYSSAVKAKARAYAVPYAAMQDGIQVTAQIVLLLRVQGSHPLELLQVRQILDIV